MTDDYYVPVGPHRVEIVVNKSRFIATAARADTPQAANRFIGQVREEMPDASHHVYAFRAGYGNNVIEGMSDDGEPSGTSGPPSLAVLRGTDLGDVVVVVTRYFGGKKLGKGGLVRAYGDAVRAVLDDLPTTIRTEVQRLQATLAYSHYEPVKRLLVGFRAQVAQETFMEDVTLSVDVPLSQAGAFQAAVTDTTLGQVIFEAVGPPRST